MGKVHEGMCRRCWRHRRPSRNQAPTCRRTRVGHRPGVACRRDQEPGLRLRWRDGCVCEAKVEAYQRAADAGKQDLVVLAVKAYDLEHVARDIGHLLHPDTMVMTLQNGIPWWYFQKMGGHLDGTRLRSVDPTGILSDTIEADRIIGCVAYPAAAVIAPGVIQHVEGIASRSASWTGLKLRESNWSALPSTGLASDRGFSNTFLAPTIVLLKARQWNSLWAHCTDVEHQQLLVACTLVAVIENQD